ncbi:uncharacterized protein LOC106866740 isoform X1 [Brachypodium distachyon]|uniref:Uncharacterized protein n=2 Tax=Brachypodium distachyon TaxID=15368 RepID=A0A2K2CU14_BRADI|nr:uncharacterized protein LOC106866740 isoform X1 [Brachypodium distachyon]PNT65509.1 hypothetical protein BRADI_4g43471v3 [Brachypodium distachyon]|eukprot:XP_014757918.2 uncharacterized protein LOC106866740 isoform X1 [Brachypodium distachyon]
MNQRLIRQAQGAMKSDRMLQLPVTAFVCTGFAITNVPELLFDGYEVLLEFIQSCALIMMPFVLPYCYVVMGRRVPYILKWWNKLSRIVISLTNIQLDFNTFALAVMIFHASLCVIYLGWGTVKTFAYLWMPIFPFIGIEWFIKLRGPNTRTASIRLFIDTAGVVFMSYMVLLDISLSYLWLAIFPIIEITFIFKLCVELQGKANRPAGSSSSGASDHKYEEKTRKELPEQNMLLILIPFSALCLIALFIDDHAGAADMFAFSLFLLFLSTTLGALTYMAMRLPTGISPGIAPASQLLQKTSLLLLLVTGHTLVAELLGQNVVLICMPEVFPVLLWFSLHLDSDKPIISIDKMKPHKTTLSAVVVIFGCLVTYMDESWLYRCTTILVSCGVSGLLTHYVLFILCQWPRQQACKDMAFNISHPISKQAGKGKATASSEEVAQSKKQAAKGKSKATPSLEGPAQSKTRADKGKGTAALEEAVQSKQAGKGKETASFKEALQSKKQAGSFEEAVQLLKFWANSLLTLTAVLLVLECLVAFRLGLNVPLITTLEKLHKAYADVLTQISQYISIM